MSYASPLLELRAQKNHFFLVDFFRQFRFQIRTPREKSMRFDVLHDQIGSILGYFWINTGGSEVSDVTKPDSWNQSINDFE